MKRIIFACVCVMVLFATGCPENKTVEGNVALVNKANTYSGIGSTIKFEDGRAIEVQNLVPVPITGKFCQLEYREHEGIHLSEKLIYLTKVTIDGQSTAAE